ncbi:hypothetical protein L226DRAFT_535543 [Lentinus tigrinus ALCF2SS1-7]|uniref:Uncharacterized protein n=1 Tax=Lentinus tigrinus ALCF2SS1-6 TaxID=1328759 RepID=A0A5C2SG86_9APHY|nr:hypothetical protein L227DRAFT_562589 [Lentinus tigrinus ALCF2SS1-6]RPD74678.1 hypothetical protein L226DRAFT_535543 [Lentinus tigrinus ALCF2SS1-7]
MLSCSALPSLDSSRDIVSQSQIVPSPSLPRVVVALPRNPPRLEPSPTCSLNPDESSGSQSSSPEEPQTTQKLILRKRSTSPLQIKLPFMVNRLRVPSPKSPTSGTRLPRALPPSPVVQKSDVVRTLSPVDHERTTTSEPTAGPLSDSEATLPSDEDRTTPCDMLPIRRVRFLTPPSSPEEFTTGSSEPRESEFSSDDEPIYSTSVSPSDLPLATFPPPKVLPWTQLLDNQPAGELFAATPQASGENAVGLTLGPPYAEYGVAAYPGLYVLPALDTWEEIHENLCCVLEVCAVLSDLDRSSPGAMSAMYWDPEMDYVSARCGSSGLWTCRVFPSMMF